MPGEANNSQEDDLAALARPTNKMKRGKKNEHTGTWKKAKELRELKRLAEELTAEITTIEDEIKACMGEQEKITAGE